MKYWFTINAALTEEQGRALWNKLCKYSANLTILPERADIYGNSDDPKVHREIAKTLADAGYPAERGA